ncbi:hypothetical protein P175DRAFT_0528519 [Aspergillus ochraceoroseus IBT 24754]|uniref:Uncharacterized protein n=1 Tax=Aspergillus ochraceoroseus IBT 24754 TaxID=1392256 RepID=A0A2T5M8Z5_9EURO|nr:uncharacterized protein P175DRAFT_0528519 [Aspergillus ochraceoroseus IBT 24754]PTU24997.1 hypothetical protein P175DRAFT_0528519 [Aspergillus ochraceoroseus IBT 24754]
MSWTRAIETIHNGLDGYTYYSQESSQQLQTLTKALSECFHQLVEVHNQLPLLFAQITASFHPADLWDMNIHINPSTGAAITGIVDSVISYWVGNPATGNMQAREDAYYLYHDVEHDILLNPAFVHWIGLVLQYRCSGVPLGTVQLPLSLKRLFSPILDFLLNIAADISTKLSAT